LFDEKKYTVVRERKHIEIAKLNYKFNILRKSINPDSILGELAKYNLTVCHSL